MSDIVVDGNASAMAEVEHKSHCRIRVIGVGGGGCNTIRHIIKSGLRGVSCVAINTDARALTGCPAPLKVQIGVKLTNGLGAGCDPNIGRKAAEESREDLKKLLSGADMIFITAGMGGGTGTGAAPVIADVARENGALTVAVITTPFTFEGKRHKVNAQTGIAELSKKVDSIIIIDNDRLLRSLSANISVINAFGACNDVLLDAVRGITESINEPGHMNMDFADVNTVMRGRGLAIIGTGKGEGPTMVQDAIENAIHSPLIEHVDIGSASGVLANVRVSPNFPMNKWCEVCDIVQSYADEEADCKVGVVFDPALREDQLSITVLITGISSSAAAANYNTPRKVLPQNSNPAVPSDLEDPRKQQASYFTQGVRRNEPNPWDTSLTPGFLSSKE